MFALLAAVAVIPAGQTFECTPTAVYDGDGPVCAPRVRAFACRALPRERRTAPARPAIPALAQRLLKRNQRWSALSANRSAPAPMAIPSFAARPCGAPPPAALAAIEPAPGAYLRAVGICPVLWCAVAGRRSGIGIGGGIGVISAAAHNPSRIPRCLP